ncbi:hypothetical protein EDD27_0805 [Nonomuraea polychroma]|uniref:Uncharacterized protein n=1 Tax=Nonomuraea polychroma TaxID=46176 RepID=A0A438LYW5_9ACTN|nr:hypothetical protein EDD27_0805 [Nonomuraea polychroma]
MPMKLRTGTHKVNISYMTYMEIALARLGWYRSMEGR